MKLVIIDYGAGNTQSVRFAFERLGHTTSLSHDREVIQAADGVIFPGVGHAAHAMEQLTRHDLHLLIPQLKKPVLGICLGMQLMCQKTEEGNCNGLGIFDVDVLRFDKQLKVPHMGWNTVEFNPTDKSSSKGSIKTPSQFPDCEAPHSANTTLSKSLNKDFAKDRNDTNSIKGSKVGSALMTNFTGEGHERSTNCLTAEKGEEREMGSSKISSKKGKNNASTSGLSRSVKTFASASEKKLKRVLKVSEKKDALGSSDGLNNKSKDSSNQVASRPSRSLQIKTNENSGSVIHDPVLDGLESISTNDLSEKDDASSITSIHPSIDKELYFYFVHSYYVPSCEATTATTHYGVTFSSMLRKEHFYACQFHPEKSGKVGEQLLQNFIDVCASYLP